MLRQFPEQQNLCSRQRNASSGVGNRAGAAVDLESADAHPIVRFRPGDRAKDRANMGFDFGRRDRLDEKVIDARDLGNAAMPHAAVPGRQHDRFANIPPTQMLRHFGTLQVGQAVVDQDCIERVVDRQRKGDQSAPFTVRLMPAFA